MPKMYAAILGTVAYASSIEGLVLEGLVLEGLVLEGLVLEGLVIEGFGLDGISRGEEPQR
jgi:hypothetical protein